jgi:hypothetical protein
MSSCLQHRKKPIKTGKSEVRYIGSCLTVHFCIIILCNRSADLRLQFLMQYSSSFYLVWNMFSWQYSSLSKCVPTILNMQLLSITCCVLLLVSPVELWCSTYVGRSQSCSLQIPSIRVPLQYTVQ